MPQDTGSAPCFDEPSRSCDEPRGAAGSLRAQHHRIDPRGLQRLPRHGSHGEGQRTEPDAEENERSTSNLADAVPLIHPPRDERTPRRDEPRRETPFAPSERDIDHQHGAFVRIHLALEDAEPC